MIELTIEPSLVTVTREDRINRRTGQPDHTLDVRVDTENELKFICVGDHARISVNELGIEQEEYVLMSVQQRFRGFTANFASARVFP